MYPNEKSFLLPYGFDAPKCGSIPEKENTHFIIGFVGRLDIYTKGLDLLIDSFELFLQSVPNSKLWIVGDSKEMPLLRQKVIEKDIQKKENQIQGSLLRGQK